MDDSKDGDMEDRIAKIMSSISDGIAIREDLNIQSSILHHAIDAAMVNHVINNGADPNARTRFMEETPLMTAIKLQRPPEVIKELLIHGAKVNLRSKIENSTPLNLAASIPKCNIEIVKMLLEQGANVDTLNKFHDTPLIHAIRNFTQSMDLIKLLLQAGASIHSKNLKWETPLITAMKNPRCTMELFTELIKHKADVNCRDVKFCTPLHHAIKCLRTNKFKIVKELMKLGCNFNARDLNGNTPLTCAIRLSRKWGSVAFYKCFIRYIVLKKSADCLEIADSRSTLIDEKILAYISACKKEVDFMKTHIINDGVSMYDYIMSQQFQVTLGDELIETLKNKTYHVYHSLIVKKAKRAVLLNSLYEHRFYTCVSKENTMLKITLDGESVINLSKYLKTYDLENLVVAYGWAFKDTIEPSSRLLKRPSEEILDVVLKPRGSSKRRKRISRPEINIKCKPDLDILPKLLMKSESTENEYFPEL